MASRLIGASSTKGWVVLASTGACLGALASVDALGVGCGSSPESGYAQDGGGGFSGGSSSSGGSGGGGASSSSGGPIGGNDFDGSLGNINSDDAGVPFDGSCPSGAGKYIYVVSDQNDLYTFDPTLVPSLTAFNKLGALECPGEVTPPPDDNSGVNSMAVDRDAVAWVNFSDGKIFKVDTTQAGLPCTDTNYAPGQGGFTAALGMGFSTVSSTSVTETLYVSDNTGPGGSNVPNGGKGLGWIDTSTMAMTTVGPWGAPLSGFNAELSGTGTGILYGFFTTTPSDLATIDKKTGNVSAVMPLPPTVSNAVGGYAFSFWGGDFWIYTSGDTDTTSVTHVIGADGGVLVEEMKSIGFTIVGAGSSTCVPTVPPPPPQ